MKNIRLAIGQILYFGVLTSFVIVLLGGIFYLLQYGHDTVHYHLFHNEPKIYKSVTDIFLDALTFSPEDIIQLGLLVLVFVQILRVGVTTWMFVESREKLFTVISLFIFLVLICSFIR